jgi:hypothetical protein
MRGNILDSRNTAGHNRHGEQLERIITSIIAEPTAQTAPTVTIAPTAEHGTQTEPQHTAYTSPAEHTNRGSRELAPSPESRAAQANSGGGQPTRDTQDGEENAVGEEGRQTAPASNVPGAGVTRSIVAGNAARLPNPLASAPSTACHTADSDPNTITERIESAASADAEAEADSGSSRSAPRNP